MEKDAYGNYRDSYGTTFQTNGGQPPTGGSPITIINGDGTTSQGSWNGAAVKSN